jgi:capsule polysaccharide modification protein KpsS
MLPKNYLYFPLHFQPEASTIALANDYIDQANAIEKLHNKLPKGFKIILKEHPAQNHTNFLRSDFFYKRIKNMKNVLFTNVNDGSLKIINNCKAVATITGTAGWEALKSKKPVITFGLAWYNCLDYAFKWNEKIDIEKICNIRVNQQKLEKSIVELTKYMADGLDSLLHRDAFDFTSDFKKEKYNFNKEIPIIAKSINKIINNH